MQTKKQSMLEALWNTFFGYIISVAVGHIVFPLYGFHATASQSFQIVAIFTFTSLLRNYVIRRWFNTCK